MHPYLSVDVSQIFPPVEKKQLMFEGPLQVTYVHQLIDANSGTNLTLGSETEQTVPWLEASPGVPGSAAHSPYSESASDISTLTDQNVSTNTNMICKLPILAVPKMWGE